VIKSHIPEGYLDARRLNGIPLANKWCSLSKHEAILGGGTNSSYNKNGILLLTRLDDPIVKILEKFYNITYIGHMWGSAHRYWINNYK
jgi:hypothetical protein